MADDWYPEPARPGVLTRLLVPQNGTRPTRWAAVTTLAGLAAFVASLLLDWVTVRIDNRQLEELLNASQVTAQNTFPVSIARSEQFAMAYLVGTLGLIVLLGLILTDAGGARRLRLGALGLGVGLLGVLAAIVRDLAQTAGGLASSTLMLGLDPRYAKAVQDAAEVALGPGMFCGAVAVILLLVGVVLAGGASAPRAQPAASGGSVLDDVPTQVGPAADGATVREAADQFGAPVAGANAATSVLGPAARSSRPVGQVGELSVSSADVIDLGGESDVLGPHRRRPDR